MSDDDGPGFGSFLFLVVLAVGGYYAYKNWSALTSLISPAASGGATLGYEGFDNNTSSSILYENNSAGPDQNQTVLQTMTDGQYSANLVRGKATSAILTRGQ